MVVFVFAADWVTPDPVAVGFAYVIPVVFAAVKGSRRLTTLTVILGVIGIGLGWFADLAQASFHFNNVRIENRLISLVSILIVGSLADIVQRNAESMVARSEQLTREFEWQRSLRQATLTSAVDRVMSALATGTTVQAITGEAARILNAAAVVWCSTQPDGTFWVAKDGASQAAVLEVRPPASFDALLQRIRTERKVQVVSAVDSIDLLLGEPLGCKDALAIPITSVADTVAVIFATIAAAPIGDSALVTAVGFARFASTAIEQAKFAEGLTRHHDSPDAGASAIGGHV